MVIKIYYLDMSYPCRTVAMALKALKLDYEIEVIGLLKGEQKSPEYLAINPRGKIPTLKDGDYVVYESRAISTYLCNQYEKGDDSTRLYPVDPKARGIVDQILYVSENTTEVITKYLNMGGVFLRNEKPNIDMIGEVHNTLKLYEEYLSKNEFMAGKNLTLADFYMQAPLLLLQLVDFDEYKNYPKTVAWCDKMKQLPYYAEVNKQGLEKLNEMYQNALKSERR